MVRAGLVESGYGGNGVHSRRRQRCLRCAAMSITTECARGGRHHAWGGPTMARGSIDWYVAADDRWHVPSRSRGPPSRVNGTPVVETRVPQAGGDAVQRIHSVADAGGFTVIEAVNDSALPVAVADAGVLVEAASPSSVWSARPAAGSRAFGRPSRLGHRRCRPRRPTSGPWPTGHRPPAPSCVAGARRRRASRFVLPEERLVDDVAAQSCCSPGRATIRRRARQCSSASASSCAWASRPPRGSTTCRRSR